MNRFELRRHSFYKVFFRSHAHWTPVAGSFKKDGNNFEFKAELHGAGAAGPVSTGETATFTGTVEPVTFVKK